MFLNIENLYGMEKKGQWEEIRKMLLSNWRKNRENIDNAIRLGTECWYVLELWDCCIDNYNLDWYKFKDTLIEVTNYGIERYNNNALFLSVFGYMISLFPYLFCDDNQEELFIRWESKGKEMIKKSYEIDFNNPLVKLIYWQEKGDKKAYKKVYKEISLKEAKVFSGKSCIEEYFNDIFYRYSKSFH